MRAVWRRQRDLLAPAVGQRRHAAGLWLLAAGVVEEAAVGLGDDTHVRVLQGCRHTQQHTEEASNGGDGSGE